MFKPELEQQIKGRLDEFINVEMGNRLTPNNWNYLILTLIPMFKKNTVEPEPEKDKEPIAEVHDIKGEET